MKHGGAGWKLYDSKTKSKCGTNTNLNGKMVIVPSQNDTRRYFVLQVYNRILAQAVQRVHLMHDLRFSEQSQAHMRRWQR